MQSIIVYIIIAAALLFTIRSVAKTITRGKRKSGCDSKGGNCDGCSGC